MRPKWRVVPAVIEADALDPRLAVEPWAGHRPFLYDYVRNIRPGSFVELGVRHGCAFFTCCQAAKDAGLDWMRLAAVDNWIGNDHDGFYGEEVYQTFLAVARSCYPGLDIQPIRRPFAEAVDQFPDASIELLHIDGYHTYEAAGDDYRRYLPKLADEGVMLLHDVFTERHGATRLWRELAAEHPSLLFEHSFGLGVLFPKGDKLYRHLLDVGLERLAPVYARIGRLEMELAAVRLQRDRLAAEAASAEARAEASETARQEALALAARRREEAGQWWQAAMDSQWRIDCLEPEPCSKP